MEPTCDTRILTAEYMHSELSNAEDHSGPICNSAVKEVISNSSVMQVTWKTAKGAPASTNDGFKAVVTAYKHFGRGFWHDWGSTVVIGVIVVALNVCAIGVLLHARRSSSSPESAQPPTCVVQQPDGTFRNANAMPPTPYPAAGLAPNGWEPRPQAVRDFPGVTGIPVNLETGRQMRYQAPPAELADVDYPRSTPINPIVMSLTDTSAPPLPDAFG
ncbi:hypothetical protein HPB51_006878 [Rhipicephalus microplus]|uniref:Uncharacterized protein n=1 Tax=Rhipicephalus microplus TaxID=6941 RepID=A0A9J6E7W4_RHIMP|nr:hypothetical protein HPB51_006878 [Rhipicephalus microplus]